MNYQAVVRGIDGNIVPNREIGIQISILHGSDSGPAVYVERHSARTNENGLISIIIGTGTVVTGDFSAIDWADGPYFLKNEFDLLGGTSYTIVGTNQLTSVPYALYALTSGSISESDPIFRASPANSITEADITNWNNKLDAEVDGSVTNELQELAINGNQLSISNGNTVILPSGGGGGEGDQWGSQVVASDETLLGDGTLREPLRINISASVFDDWDKDASDDFSGYYNDLRDKPIIFYRSRTETIPTSITDNIYHTGKLAVGTSSSDAVTNSQFFVKTNRTETKIGRDGQYGIDVSNNGQRGNAINAKITDAYTLASKSALHAEYLDDVIISDLAYLSHVGTTDTYYGLCNNLNSNGISKAIGVKNQISKRDDGVAYGMFNVMSGNGNGELIGVWNNLSQSENGRVVGTQNYLGGAGNGEQYGLYNYIDNSGDREQYGVYSRLRSNGDGTHYGTYNFLEGDGNGDQYGVFCKINTAGRRLHRGFGCRMSGEGSGGQTGLENFLSGDGAGEQYGVNNIISNNGNSNHYGVKTWIYGSGSGIHYGAYNDIRSSGTGEQYGVYNSIGGEGGGKQYGVNNNIANNGNSDHYGVKSWLHGNGSGKHFGVYNYLSGDASGELYGVYSKLNVSEDNNEKIFGTYNEIVDGGKGMKFGTYNYLHGRTGGPLYAVYGKVDGNGNYAGFFDGNVYVKYKLRSQVSGSADMKAYIYGNIGSSGSIVAAGSSGGFTCQRISTGKYKITFSTAPSSSNEYNVIVTANNSMYPRICTVYQNSSYFYVYIWKTDNTKVNNTFHFVVYKR
jgi:hypothetical protein